MSIPPYDPSFLQNLQWRCIGPPRGGRVVAVAGDPVDPMTAYFGAVAGGVWKTTDGGTYWENVSDGFFNTSSIGALAVAPSDPNVIYAGTGETTIRLDVSYGDGVYKSTDAGKTWTHLGLEETRHIGEIRVHPAQSRPGLRGCSGPRLRPQSGTGCLPLEGWGAATGKRCSTAAPRPVRWILPWTPTTPACSTPPSGRPTVTSGLFPAAVPRAAFSNPPTGATPGPRSATTRGCPRGSRARSAWPSRRRRRTGSGPLWNRSRKASTGRMTADRSGSGSATTAI